jgi:hypothetical protein
MGAQQSKASSSKEVFSEKVLDASSRDSTDSAGQALAALSISNEPLSPDGSIALGNLNEWDKAIAKVHSAARPLTSVDSRAILTFSCAFFPLIGSSY